MTEHILRITGSSSLPEPLLMDNEYLFSVKAGINKIEKKSNEDGEATFTYSAKQITVEVLKKDGTILKTKDKTKQSIKLRLALLGLKPDGVDEDQFYQNSMGAIRHYLPEVMDYIAK